MSLEKQILVQLYKDNVRNIYRYFYKRTLSNDVSEDLTSTVFLLFTEKVTRSSSEIDNYQKYLFGIAKKVLYQRLREKYKNKEINLGLEEMDLASKTSDIDLESESDQKYSQYLEDRVKQLLPQLPQKQREIIEMRFIDGLSLKEITQKINKDMNYVKTTQKRGLHSLRVASECTPITTNISGGKYV